MPKLFNVTYEIITQESAEHGDAADRGYIAESVTLRDAVAELGATRTARVDGRNEIEADCCAPGIPRWITISNGMEFETGAYESRALHIPDNVTPSSAVRIARYLGVYTYAKKKSLPKRICDSALCECIATRCITWQSSTMSAPAFWYLCGACTKHALEEVVRPEAIKRVITFNFEAS